LENLNFRSHFCEIAPRKITITNTKLFTINNNHVLGNDEEYRIVRHPIDCVLENPSFTFSYYSHSYHLKNPAITRNRNDSNIVGSCNGLLLLDVDSGSNKEDFEHLLRVWNPTTRIASETSYFHYHGLSRFAFRCDNSTGTYKVVAICIFDQLEVRVLDLGGGSRDVWRNIESFPVPLCDDDCNYVYLSGTLNWLAIRNNNTFFL